MANNYENMNVRQKLIKARLSFLNAKVQKSGKNINLEFKYFELDDISPVATRIFNRIGLISDLNLDGEKATMTIYNADNPEEPGISFVAPYRENKPIISNTGKQVTNDLQTLGASITYLRRYLWMMVLDISEPDETDANLGSEEDTTETEFKEEIETAAPKEKKSKKKTPATTEERKEAKKELTQEDSTATEEEITTLKGLCKELMDKDESQEEFVQQIAMKTDGFTNITASACTALCENLTEILAQYSE